MLDFLIKNGWVLDPSTDGDGFIRPIGVKDGVFADVGDEREAAHVIDADGAVIAPGLCDFHAHFVGKGGICIDSPELLLSTGVTAVCDAGTAGCDDYEKYRRAESVIKTRAFLLVSGEGQHPNYKENPDPSKYDREAIKALFEKYPRELIGLKLRLSRDIVGSFGIKPLDASVALAEEIGVPLCVHVTDAPCRAGEIAERLRPGDIFSHVYHGVGETILDDNGRVQRSLFLARERGVLFDEANGRMNFSFKVARKAIEQGFLPDIISTDITGDKQFTAPYAKDLPSVMSKMTALGMPKRDVLRAVTSVPLGVMGMACPSFEAGKPADLAIFREADKPVVMKDCFGDSVTVDIPRVAQMTMVGGHVVYCYGGFAN